MNEGVKMTEFKTDCVLFRQLFPVLSNCVYLLFHCRMIYWKIDESFEGFVYKNFT